MDMYPFLADTAFGVGKRGQPKLGFAFALVFPSKETHRPWSHPEPDMQLNVHAVLNGYLT